MREPAIGFVSRDRILYIHINLSDPQVASSDRNSSEMAIVCNIQYIEYNIIPNALRSIEVIG